jgi:hypothetical protein
MTQDPTPYDLLQDAEISVLQELVTPYYSPPGDQEYSFPVVGQGVSSEMFQQISRAAGTGVFVQHDAEGAQSPYRLTGMPGGDAETNAQNTMMLRTSNVTGRSEAAISGFFHTQTEDMVISFPPVTTSTTYYLALTYDPRREEEESGPIRIEVHANDLPTTHRRKHIVLYTVRREPNQLLTQATITRTLPWLGHVINVWSYDDLPEPTSVEYGTLAVVVNPSRGHVPNIYTNRGVHGWVNTAYGDWEDITEIRSTWRPTVGFPHRARLTPTGVQIDCTVSPDGRGTLSETGMELFRLPSYVRPPAGTNTTNALLLGVSQTQTGPVAFRLNADGAVTNLKPYTSNLGWVRVYGEIFYN